MKSLEIIDDFVKYYDELLYGILRDHAPCCEGDLEEIMERRNKLLIIKKDLEELEKWRKGEFIITHARHMRKTPYCVLASKVLDKYMRAFEILSSITEAIIEHGDNPYFAIEYISQDGATFQHIDIEKEDRELLEELMKDAKD